MLAYVFLGPYLPGLMSHKGASLGRAASHFWLTSEGVFGVALGVSTQFIFLFVLFGALLEKAGAGNFFIQLAFSLLGQFRGGPAKAAVVSSGMTGMISGSSVANVVTTGVFTIPLMKRVGYSPTQAGAIECAAGVNGQLMPPVMGAAAFIMAEYVGISYADVVKHAIIPALLTYGALFYVVDLEAVKAGMSGIARTRRRTLQQGLIKAAITISSHHHLQRGHLLGPRLDARRVRRGGELGRASPSSIVAYVALIANRARFPDLPLDDLSKPVTEVPDFYDVARTGIHYLLPVSVLIWCLMVEEMSPGLAAFWGVIAMGGVVLTQKPLTAFFRRQGDTAGAWRDGFWDFVSGLELGARNMAAVGIATAAAGIMVGTVTLTGIGLVMAEIVEFLSGGNIVIMLSLVGVICIILGAGLPTTASYVVVATLMAPVVVELAAENDLAVPLIAVHMFVFYFGLMADVSPPVGLAAYAAAAIAGADPMRVGWQGTWYELRTLLLPFIFIFNPEILLIDIGGPLHFIVVIGCATLAMMAFVAALQGFFFTRNRWWETVAPAADLLHAVPAEFLDGSRHPALPGLAGLPGDVGDRPDQGRRRLARARRHPGHERRRCQQAHPSQPRRQGNRGRTPWIIWDYSDAGRQAEHRLGAAWVGSGAPEAEAGRHYRRCRGCDATAKPIPVRHPGAAHARRTCMAAASPSRCARSRCLIVLTPSHAQHDPTSAQ